MTRIAGPGEAPPSTNYTSFLHYTGHWGDTQYPDEDPRQEAIPKFGLRRFVTGPNGPLFKRIVRSGLEPDGKRRLTWLEWSVGIYLAWYPCCLAGWRIWMSLGVVIIGASGVILAIFFGAKALRRRSWRRTHGTDYKRVQADDIPLEDWQSADLSLLSDDDDVDDNDGRNRTIA